jgi:hypothetical protein
MGSVIPELDERLRGWIAKQPVFFVATAPSDVDGRVNLSPKGGSGTFAALGPHEFAYVDLFGSGIETVAHLKQNGRIVVLFCAFDGPPQIVRLHGRGESIEMHDPRFDEMLPHFEITDEMMPAVRGIIRVDITRISDSCGFVVPLMDYQDERRQLYRTAGAWVRQRGPDAIRDYCDVNNAESIDGLPGLAPFRERVTDDQRAMHSHEGRKL